MCLTHVTGVGNESRSKPLISNKHVHLISLLLGVMLGVAACQAVLWIGGLAPVDRQELSRLEQTVADLEAENRELSDELFSPRLIPGLTPIDLVRPYDDEADARAEVDAARAAALDAGKFLMVTFGANWCQDCRTLYVHLESDDVAGYVRDRFEFAHVNVGKFNRNTELAEELGVSLERGIPVAIFYDPQGAVIGTTNDGQLEPSRLYSSKQILKFVRDVAERSRILAPDAVR